MRKRGGFDKGVLLLFVIILILVGTGIFLYAQVRTDKISELVKKDTPFTVAFFVTDKTNVVKWRDRVLPGAVGGESQASASPPPGGSSAGGTQSAAATGNANQTAGAPAATKTGSVGAKPPGPLLFTELFSYDPKTNKGALLDIPGNVGSLISSIEKIDRIDVLFKPGKVDPYRNKIADLIGSSIPLYIETDITDIPKIVDLLGGLDLFIANPIEQTGSSPMVLLPSGSITLDGSKVESYLSYRSSSDSNIEVIARRQRFVQALLKAIGKHSVLFDRRGVYSAFKSWITTDMNRRSMLSFIDLMSKLDTQNMIFQRVLGVDRTVDNQVLLFPHYNGRLLRETVQQTFTALANPQAAGNQALTVRLQILNGTNITGLAHRTSQIFQSFGYDVVSVANAAKSDYAHTEIFGRSGNISQAQQVARVIRCTRVQSSPAGVNLAAGQGQAAGPSPSSDVTIILGSDFDGRYCK